MNSLVKQPNATLADLYLGTTQKKLEDELQSLISRHGAKAVRDAVLQLTKGKKGRKPEPDWKELQPYLQQDAIDWLNGVDPFSSRTNYSIACEFSEARPGHNRASTQRRIMRKLATRRKVTCLLRAWSISEDERPYADYFRVCEEVASIDEWWGERIFRWSDMQRGALQRFREKHGEPDPSMTIKQIEEIANRPVGLLASLASVSTLGGMLGGSTG